VEWQNEAKFRNLFKMPHSSQIARRTRWSRAADQVLILGWPCEQPDDSTLKVPYTNLNSALNPKSKQPLVSYEK